NPALTGLRTRSNLDNQKRLRAQSKLPSTKPTSRAIQFQRARAAVWRNENRIQGLCATNSGACKSNRSKSCWASLNQNSVQPLIDADNVGRTYRVPHTSIGLPCDTRAVLIA